MNRPSVSVRRREPQAHLWPNRVAGRLLAAVGAASAVLLAGASYSQASTYLVYTSSISAMSLNQSDGYCSLAEAVASANAGHSMYNCPEIFPGGDQQIQILEAAGKSFSAYHFKITSLSINSPNRWVDIYTPSAPSRFFIDSTGSSGIVVQSGTSFDLVGANLTFTGTAGGRHLENRGTLDIYDSTLANGNVTSHPDGLGGAIYSQGTMEVYNVSFTRNKAKRGGAIYNKAANIIGLTNSLISGNSATMAGGGIYNLATAAQNGFANADITGAGTTITSNTAPAGGGVFNRGSMTLQSSAITFNKATGTGSGERCASGASCDGAGGGVLVLNTSVVPAEFHMTGSSSLNDNTASGFGGGVYNTGKMALEGITIARNQARSGAAIYFAVIALNQYCTIHYSDSTGPSSIVGNKTVPAGGYSIVDGFGDRCAFEDSILVPAWNNISPYCAAGMANPCPQ
jgi:predicted outer membrane repeat protein